MTIATSPIFIRAPGPRPPYYLVAQHLWGADCNFDSDGNSETPDDSLWTELTVALRDSAGHTTDRQRLDIDPSSYDPLVLRVSSADPELALSAATYIVDYSGGAFDSATE